MPRGGRREGAGRKPLIRDEHYKQVIDEVWKPRFREICQIYLEKALDEKTSDKERLRAIEYIMNRVLGTPKQQIEADNTHDIQLTFARVSRRLDESENANDADFPKPVD